MNLANFIITIKRFALKVLEKIVITDRLSKKHPISVKGVIFYENKVILLKNFKGEWDLPGGKIDDGENVITCLKREIKEELNLDVTPKKIIHSSFLKIKKKFNVFVVFFLCDLTGDLSQLKISFEHIDVKLFHMDEVKSLNIPILYEEIILKNGLNLNHLDTTNKKHD